MEAVAEDMAEKYSLTCNNIKDRYILAIKCVNDPNRAALDCVPNAGVGLVHEWNNENRNVMHTLRITLGIWCILVAVVGVFGNLLTLLSLPYAKKKRLHFFHENWIG